MRAKRSAVWVLSSIIGIIGAFGTVAAFGTTVEKFSFLLFAYDNFIILALAYAAFVWVWLDYFMGTEMMPK